MKIALITGSAGLIGSEAAKFFHKKGFSIVGIDNDMRRYFFGVEASTDRKRSELQSSLEGYSHKNVDIRNEVEVRKIFNKYGKDISVVIHTAAQPSHDWAAKEPFTDFSVNATGTLNLLENTRLYCKGATFIFTSTNKVYGDTPNRLPLIEKEKRWEIAQTHKYFDNGIDESMSIDDSKHSVFGASKVAADVMVQEYGKYFQMNTVCFRGGCLTGPAHAGAELHGFLAYLVKCAIAEKEYTVFGYKGKQVRDNIHSYDLVNAFWHFHESPRSGEVYNVGGGRGSNCSILEAIEIIKELSGRDLKYKLSEQHRSGDHIWWVSNMNKFKKHYPCWSYQYNIRNILKEITDEAVRRYS